MSSRKPRILCVDDEIRILESFRRGLRNDFDVTTAEGGIPALKLIESEEPFEVILTDMRMPAMDGVEFLTQAARKAPKSVRMMLTGYADQQTAIQAINDGRIFRFLSKPTPIPMLITALKDGVEQYRLITAEQELLEKTLNGAVKVLTDVLSITNSVAYARATQIRKLALEIAFGFDIQETWKLEMASQLYLVGSVTVPEDVFKRYSGGLPLDEQMQKMIDDIPVVTRRLLEHIPRLESVLAILDYTTHNAPVEFNRNDPSWFFGNIIRCVNQFHNFLERGISYLDAIKKMRLDKLHYNESIIEVLYQVVTGSEDTKTKIVSIDDLKPGEVLASDIRNINGMLLAPAGFIVNDAMCQRLMNYHLQGIVEDEVVINIE